MKRFVALFVFLVACLGLFANQVVLSNTDTRPGQRTEYTLSYHNSTLSHTFYLPDNYGDTEYGVKYTPAADCSLLSWQFLLYAKTGTFTNVMVHVYSEGTDGNPGTSLGTMAVARASLVLYTTGYNVVDLSSLNLNFSAQQSFFITMSVTGGSYSTRVVRWITDDASTSTAETNRTYELNTTDGWNTMAATWGTPYEMFADAIVNYAAEPDPILTINPTSVAFGHTAIDGYKLQTINVSNTGGGNIILNSIGYSGSSDMFIVSAPTLPDTLTANEAASIVVGYGPTTTSGDTGTITILHNLAPSPTTISVSGTGYHHNSWASANAIFDQSPTGTQGDNDWSMSTSDAEPAYLVADNFWGLTESIAAVEFWGINWYYNNGWVQSATEDPMQFIIKFYAENSDNSAPGSEVASYNLTLNRTVVDSVTFSSGPVYKYRAELPTAVTLQRGWVSIQGNTVSGSSTTFTPWFLWSQSPVGDYYHTSYSSSTWSGDTVDTAFALFGPSATPTNVAISISGNNAILNWQGQAGTTYNVYASDTADGTYQLVGTTTATTYTHTGAASANTHKFYHITAGAHTTRAISLHPEFKQAHPGMTAVTRNAVITQ